jgi:archaellum biogenesis protein FlaJ (TadC family)
MKAAQYLPDALRMMASNMQSGIAADHALIMAGRREFGILGNEIKQMGTDMLKNMTFEEALERLKGRIKSEPLHLSANLISHGIRAGRGLHDSLFQIAETLQHREHTRQEIITHFQSIRTTIVLLVVISAPLLFSCSIVASQIMGEFNNQLGDMLPGDILEQSWIVPGKSLVSTTFLNNYIMASLFITSLFGAIIMGEVTSGKVMNGLRYAFMLVLSSELFYLIGRALLWENIGGVFAW